MRTITTLLKQSALVRFEKASEFLFWASLLGCALLQVLLYRPDVFFSWITNPVLGTLLIVTAVLLSFLGGLLFIPAGIFGVWRYSDERQPLIRVLGSAACLGVSAIGVMMIATSVQVVQPFDLQKLSDIIFKTANS